MYVCMGIGEHVYVRMSIHVCEHMYVRVSIGEHMYVPMSRPIGRHGRAQLVPNNYSSNTNTPIAHTATIQYEVVKDSKWRPVTT
jgi:hypothetical protein